MEFLPEVAKSVDPELSLPGSKIGIFADQCLRLSGVDLPGKGCV